MTYEVLIDTLYKLCLYKSNMFTFLSFRQAYENYLLLGGYSECWS